MEFYSFNDYRKCLRAGLERLATRGEKITSSELATAIGVQSPYLSKVFSGAADLNEDQLYLACEKLKFGPDESEYVRLLLAASRSSVKKRRDLLNERIAQFQQRMLSPDEARQAPRLQEENDLLSRYYLNPAAQIVHMFLTIPSWRRQPLALAEHLRLAPEALTEILQTLEGLGVIESRNGAYHLLKDQLHLPPTSPLCTPQQTLMKVHGLRRRQELDEKDITSFVATFSADAKAKLQIQQLFADFLKKTQKIVADAPSEEVYQLQFDLFPWG